jgi:hypothetical protein
MELSPGDGITHYNEDIDRDNEQEFEDYGDDRCGQDNENDKDEDWTLDIEEWLDMYHHNSTDFVYRQLDSLNSKTITLLAYKIGVINTKGIDVHTLKNIFLDLLQALYNVKDVYNILLKRYQNYREQYEKSISHYPIKLLKALIETRFDLSTEQYTRESLIRLLNAEMSVSDELL